MDRAAFQEWLSHIPELTPEQVLNLRGSLSHLHQQNSKGPIQASEDWLWPGIARALVDQNQLSQAAIPSLLSSSAFSTYRESAPRVMAELNPLVDGSSRRRRQLAYVVGCALIAYCDHLRLPKRPRFVLAQVRNARVALEVCFPGYIQAGLLHLILGGKHGSKIPDNRTGSIHTRRT